jgi:hypothetical protein
MYFRASVDTNYVWLSTCVKLVPKVTPSIFETSVECKRGMVWKCQCTKWNHVEGELPICAAVAYVNLDIYVSIAVQGYSFLAPKPNTAGNYRHCAEIDCHHINNQKASKARKQEEQVATWAACSYGFSIFGLLFNHENGAEIFFRNVGFSPTLMTSYS